MKITLTEIYEKMLAEEEIPDEFREYVEALKKRLEALYK